MEMCPHFRGWNRGVPLCTDVSLFLRVGIENTKVYSFQGVGIVVYRGVRGVGIERFHCVQRCSHFRGLE